MKKNFLSTPNNYKQILTNFSGNIDKENQQRFVASIYIILTLFTVSFFGIFAISPTLTTITNLQKQLEDDTSADKTLKQKLLNLQSLDTAYQQLIPDLPSIYLAIPTTAKIPYLTAQIENLSQSNNVQLQDFSINPIQIFPNENKDSPLYSFLFTIVIEGNQADISNFLGQFINFDRIVNLETITINKGESDFTRATIEGKAFFYSKQ